MTELPKDKAILLLENIRDQAATGFPSVANTVQAYLAAGLGEKVAQMLSDHVHAIDRAMFEESMKSDREAHELFMASLTPFERWEDGRSIRIEELVWTARDVSKWFEGPEQKGISALATALAGLALALKPFETAPGPEDAAPPQDIECEACDGTGLMEGWNRRDGYSCPKCHGTGTYRRVHRTPSPEVKPS